MLLHLLLVVSAQASIDVGNLPASSTANVCQCPNGIAATGPACTVNGANICTNCFQGFEISGTVCAQTRTFTLLGNGACRDATLMEPPSCRQKWMSEADCRKACAGHTSCSGFQHNRGDPDCKIYIALSDICPAILGTFFGGTNGGSSQIETITTHEPWWSCYRKDPVGMTATIAPVIGVSTTASVIAVSTTSPVIAITTTSPVITVATNSPVITVTSTDSPAGTNASSTNATTSTSATISTVDSNSEEFEDEFFPSVHGSNQTKYEDFEL